MPENVALLVENLYTEAIEAVRIYWLTDYLSASQEGI
jgi:hypothetical protein